MDTLLIIALAIIGLLILALALTLRLTRESGSLKLTIELPGFIRAIFGAETKESSARAEQIQKEAVRSAQEQPRGANARQSQEKTIDSIQKIT
jgi:hypothetical protein